MSAPTAKKIPPDELHVWMEKRLRKEGRDDLADILEACRVPFHLICLCCQSEAVVNKGCAKRWCPVCGPKVTAKRYARVAPIAARMQWPLSVMLSIKNPAHIEGCVRTLKAAFKKFRKLKFWKDTVKGGFVGYEMTHNGRGVHVHLHALVDCEWLAISTPKETKRHTSDERKRLRQMAQAELAAAWAASLGQAQAVVWVRRADKQALAETLKYPFKPADFPKLKCRISDIIDEIDRGRNVAGFGNCHATSKAFLGRDQPAYVEKLCPECSTDRSFVPATIGQAAIDMRNATGCLGEGGKRLTSRQRKLVLTKPEERIRYQQATARQKREKWKPAEGDDIPW